MGHVSLAAITGTTILVPYLSQVTATHLKLGYLKISFMGAQSVPVT